MYVSNDVSSEAIAGKGHEHLSSAFPPHVVVGRADARNGGKEKFNVITLSKFISWRGMLTQPHQHLRERIHRIQQLTRERQEHEPTGEIESGKERKRERVCNTSCERDNKL